MKKPTKEGNNSEGIRTENEYYQMKMIHNKIKTIER